MSRILLIDRSGGLESKLMNSLVEKGHECRTHLRGGDDAELRELILSYQPALVVVNSAEKEPELEALVASSGARVMYAGPTVIAKSRPDRAQESIGPQTNEGPHELSPSQERLWLFSQGEGAGHVYNAIEVFHARGALDLHTLRKALSRIVERHAVLRTRYALGENGIRQYVSGSYTPEVWQIDLTEAAEAAPQAVAEAVRRYAQIAYDLSQPRVLRVAVFNSSPTDRYMVFILHHIAADGESFWLFLKELAIFYEAESSGPGAELPGLQMQYVDYAQRQREKLRRGEFDGHIQYWKQKLEGAQPMVLPFDGDRLGADPFRGAVYRFGLGAEFSAALKGFCRREHLTPFTACFGALQLLLWIYTGQNDIAIATIVTDRKHREYQPLIGLLTNTLVLRTDLSGNPTVQTVLAQARELTAEALVHSEAPFERVVQELNPERIPGINPVSNVMMSFHQIASEEVKLRGVRLESVPVNTGISRWDLHFSVSQHEADLQCAVHYSRGLFTATTIERLSAHWRELLEAIMKQPQLLIGELARFTTQERARIREFESGPQDTTQDRNLVQMLARCGAGSEDTVAAVAGEEHLTLQALWDRALSVEQVLREHAIGLEERVGIYLDPDVDMIAAIWGVLKSGGAFVPLEADWPVERVRAICNRAAIRVIVGREQPTELVEQHRSWVDMRSLVPGSGSGIPAFPASAAYVLFTSGSSGGPKGVVVENRQLLNYIAGANERIGWRPGTRALLVQSLSTDAAMTLVFGAVLHGGTLHLISKETALNWNAVAAYIRLHGINQWKLAPSHLQAILPDSWEGKPLALSTLILGGERVSAALIDKFRCFAPCCRIINQYGPTETTVGCTLQTWEAAEAVEGRVPIGRPIRNTSVYILDSNLDRMALGATGGFFIAGAGVARGYLNDAALTAENFLPDPFGRAGTRMYRTGDRGRFRPDGLIEFLGREDRQVRIRGYRVEPAEIEAVLLSHESVKEAFVDAERSETRAARLVAYVSPRLDAPAAAAVERHARQQCLTYTVPNVFIFIDKLPRTAHGKVDRQALAKIKKQSAEMSHEQTKKMDGPVARLWREVLGLEHVAAGDNFFLLGGHSLLAARLVSRLRSEMKIEMNIGSLFRAPTLELFCDEIRAAQADVRARAGGTANRFRVRSAGRPSSNSGS